MSLQTSAECFLLDDNLGEFELMDTRSCTAVPTDEEEIPAKITGTYSENYNILYVDQIVRKRLHQEKFTYLEGLKSKYSSLCQVSSRPQTYVMRKKTLDEMQKIKDEIKEIETGSKLQTYINQVDPILQKYRQYNGKVKTVFFDMEEEDEFHEMDDDVRHRISLIDKYFEIACEYIDIEVIRIHSSPADLCIGCGKSLADVATDEDDIKRCPHCQTEHNMINLTKMSKDGARINTASSTEDESFENFERAFIRYQGQQDPPDEKIYEELDNYFTQGIDPRPSGAEIRKLPLNSRGRRGDTDHKMLWNALSKIGRSEYYDDTNLIGHIYWGWTLPNVAHLRDRIRDKYIKTQKEFYKIPPEERGRNSSLGTQFRLWRHLQLEGHDCHMNEFKIAENPDSLRTHNRLWRLMVEGANDPDIYYIP